MDLRRLWKKWARPCNVLADQLRRMQGELEAQIIAQHTDDSTKYADFDPLEMDQYSSVNQLSKSLYESASDLMDIKVTLIEKARDTENAPAATVPSEHGTAGRSDEFADGAVLPTGAASATDCPPDVPGTAQAG